MTKEHIVKEGTYIPLPLDQFPEIPDQPMFNPEIVRHVELDENYPYLDKSFKARFMNFLVYTGIFTLVFPFHRIRYGLKFKGKENLRNNKKLLSNGAMTISNHVYRWDFLAILQAVKYRRMWFPARGKNMEGKDAGQIRAVGGIPIPENLKGLMKFKEAFDELHAKKKWIHIFPESCRWEWYEPIRPFKLGSFSMAIRYNLPVVPMAITYRKPTGIYKLLGVKHPLTTVNIGEPLLPDTNLPRKDAARKLLHEAHQSMCNMAGIEQNGWEELGD
ncbi:MAG: 1-acyl-sn-glycerol-3-phosphate acyltransferase [Treponema sp.]|nr:1-acyl-sn-glycerol-3-phosphate acyltransferase [Treponema sp.]